LLAEIGRGAEGALTAATSGAAQSPGVRSGGQGRLIVGEPADVVVLRGNPLIDVDVWREPVAVFVAGRRVSLKDT
jgi:imidazolonepropionase-like amidohydrolase